MKHFYIQEEGTLTVIQAQTALQAAEHYAQHHGWRLPQDALRLLRPGHWQMFGGEILIFDQAPTHALMLESGVIGGPRERP